MVVAAHPAPARGPGRDLVPVSNALLAVPRLRRKVGGRGALGLLRIGWGCGRVHRRAGIWAFIKPRPVAAGVRPRPLAAAFWKETPDPIIPRRGSDAIPS